MRTTRFLFRIALLATTLSVAHPAFAADASLQAEVAALKAQLAAQAEQLARLEAKLQAVSSTQVTQAQTLQTVTAQAETAAAAPLPSFTSAGGQSTTIGGYGEVSYNGYLRDRSRNQADLKRFVLFFGHRFNDKISFNSEVEVEHAIASSGDSGEIEIEQAYINYAVNPAVNVKTGLFLMPFGFINRTHEPPNFFGVERNEIETRIIPTTYREGGVGVWGTTDFGLTYDFGVTTTFSFAKFDDAGSPLRATHQELALAHAANLQVYGSLEYRPLPGVLVGGAYLTGNTGQSNADFKADPGQPDFSGIKGRVTLWDVHARVERGGFDVKALYAQGSYSNAAVIDGVIEAYNIANGTDRPIVPSRFYGWLVQGAYTFHLGETLTLSPFARYEKFDTQARLPTGFTSDPENRDRVFTAGLSLKPIDDVVVKFDYQRFIENRANDRINLGLGYQF